MAVYQQILDWSSGRPNFIKDALRRIVTTTNLTQTDINELADLVKKECGDTSVNINAIPLDITHFPATITVNGSFPKLINLLNPINISALYSQGGLQFSNIGLNVVYGKNGSGKSSYSRILKKLCWSRNPSVTLKKNVFNPSTNQQQVDFVVEVNGANNSFTWVENTPSNTISILYLFLTVIVVKFT